MAEPVFLGAYLCCDLCDEPLVEAEAPTCTLKSDEDRILAVLHVACARGYCEKAGIELPENDLGA